MKNKLTRVYIGHGQTKIMHLKFTELNLSVRRPKFEGKGEMKDKKKISR